VSRTKSYSYNVFINCPFDGRYKPIFRAITFAVIDCGYTPRCAQELDDATEERLTKIMNLIENCKYGIHDISRTQLDINTRLPRFNMPFELGLFLSAKRFGGSNQKRKNALILDVEDYRYKSFLSDIAGRDVKGHRKEIKRVFRIVRDWLSTSSSTTIPSGAVMARKYQLFHNQLSRQCGKVSLVPAELTFVDFVTLIEGWLDKYEG